MADPPLMRLETEAGHAYLSVLVHMVAQAAKGEGLEAAQACQVGGQGWAESTPKCMAWHACMQYGAVNNVHGWSGFW